MNSGDRSVRPKTKEATKATLEKEKERKLFKKLKGTSKSLKQLVAQEEENILELSNYSKDKEAETSLESDDSSDIFEESNASFAEFNDPLNVVPSPLKEKSCNPEFKQRTTPSPSSWSGSNQFFPEGCLRSPLAKSNSNLTHRGLALPRNNLEDISEVLDEITAADNNLYSFIRNMSNTGEANPTNDVTGGASPTVGAAGGTSSNTGATGGMSPNVGDTGGASPSVGDTGGASFTGDPTEL